MTCWRFALISAQEELPGAWAVGDLSGVQAATSISVPLHVLSAEGTAREEALANFRILPIQEYS